MGKRKAPSTEDDLLEAESPSSAHKKHKKHKKKHKKKRDFDCETDTVAECTSHEDSSPTKPTIKLKIKIGGQTLTSQSITSPVSIANAPIISIKAENPNKDEDVDIDDSGLQSLLPPPLPPPPRPPPITVIHTEQAAVNVFTLPTDKKADTQWQGIKIEPGDDTFITKKKGEDTSDEEQQWLDALEAGTLDDNGEVKKEKDSRLLTARQRALIHGTREENLQQLPSGYKTTELTEEQLQRRQQRAHKRRQQAQEKREKDKKQTLERLLKKQDAKSKGAAKTRSRRHQVAPMYRYVQRLDASCVYIPQGFSFPFQCRESNPSAKQKQQCGIKGCSNPKKYSCSKTQLPLCSLLCYKKNQLLLQQRATAATR